MLIKDIFDNAFNPIYRPKRKKSIPKISEKERSGKKPDSDDPTMEREEYSGGKRQEFVATYNDHGQINYSIVGEGEYPKLDEIG